jgi:alpha-D-xyloside xylohydrolase
LFDPARYPDPVGMFKNCTTMHYHTLISVWAKFDLGSDNSKELNAVGGMFPQVTRMSSPPGQGQWYDPFSTQGRQTYWKQMRDQLFAKGVDGWWLDAPEPEIGGMGFRTYTTPMGPGYEVYNAYPLMHSMGIYQGQRAATDKNASSSSPVRPTPASSATAPSPGRATSREPGRFSKTKSPPD